MASGSHAPPRAYRRAHRSYMRVAYEGSDTSPLNQQLVHHAWKELRPRQSIGAASLAYLPCVGGALGTPANTAARSHKAPARKG
jgi:hypothetical protein